MTDKLSSDEIKVLFNFHFKRNDFERAANIAKPLLSDEDISPLSGLYLEMDCSPYGKIGEQTNIKDRNGNVLYVGDRVTYKSALGRPYGVIVYTAKDGFFLMGFAGTQDYTKYKLERTISFKSLKDGERFGEDGTFEVKRYA